MVELWARVSSREEKPMPQPARVLVPLVAALLGVVPPSSGRAAPADGIPAHEVEAEFIERFTRFIDWPDAAFASAGSPFVVCTWGSGPLASQLERALARRRIKQRPVRSVRITELEALAPCHVLYLALGNRDLVRTISTRAYGKPLLSVGDQPGLAEAGLLINLIVDEGGFVRFEINRDVAKASGLKISAKLMRLARLVGGRP